MVLRRFTDLVWFLFLLILVCGTVRTSPTIDETGHLPGGLSHLCCGKFDLYRVNPPLIRSTATIPVFYYGARIDCNYGQNTLITRQEFPIGEALFRANGEQSLWLFTLARFACIPFTLLGAWICLRWARELYGETAGTLALALWCLCPSILGHGALITPDVGGASFAVAACYFFWRWLREPTWRATLFAGLVLGLAELTKFTNVLLVALFPLMLAAWSHGQPWRARLASLGKLVCMMLLALVVINAGYLFEGSCTRLGDYPFISEKFGGPERANRPRTVGNRFAGTWLGSIPVPLPVNYLRGIDVQVSDFEDQRMSYLRGEFRRQGWYHYYLYAMLVKVPLGTWLIFCLAVFLSLWFGVSPIGWRNELVLGLPLVGYLAFVSLETGFNHHLRYVLAVFPFFFIWMSRVASPVFWRWRAVKALVAAGLCWVAVSDVRVAPHFLSYFNELAGGPENGAKHLLDSNIDWGQDLIFLKKWLDEHPEARPMHVAYFGLFEPKIIYPEMLSAKDVPCQNAPRPGWYAISVNEMHGYAVAGIQTGPRTTYTYFQRLTPVGRAGYSMYIFHVTLEDANRLRHELGYPDWEEPHEPQP